MGDQKGKGQLASRTELAEFFGVSGPTVDHWVRTGAPYVERGGPGKKWTFNTADVASWRLDRARESAKGKAPATENELRIRKLSAQTEAAELQLAKARGEVAPVEAFERAMSSAFAEVKAVLRNVPSRAARQLIGETDEARFKRVLLGEIDQALDALADAELIAEDKDEGDEE